MNVGCVDGLHMQHVAGGKEGLHEENKRCYTEQTKRVMVSMMKL